MYLSFTLFGLELFAEINDVSLWGYESRGVKGSKDREIWLGKLHFILSDER